MMKQGLLDPYAIKARGFPLFMLAAPVLCGVWPWLAAWPVDAWLKGLVGGVVSGLLLAFLVNFGGQISRDLGRVAEDRLRVQWGAHRTGRLLRWSDGTFRSQKATMLANLAALTGIPAPTAADEERDPSAADRIYEDYAERLRAYALAHKAEPRFAMVNEERAEYGQARNFYGLRHVMWTLVALGAISLGAAAWFGYGIMFAGVALAGSALLSGYLARASLVKRRSDDFAKRLLEAALEPLHVVQPTLNRPPKKARAVQQ